ncbi:hypothetical protein FQR65_LT12189 [Abscondita terminalis]|nr:hypothetical protein FQR65_LT12189 [Abscondita terminalis]
MKTLVFAAIFFATNQWGQCARILGVVPTPSYSHQVWLHPLWKELSLRGHQVTVLTTNPINDPTLTNLTEIDTSFSYRVLTDQLLEIINTRNPIKILELNIKVFTKIADKQLEHPPVKQLITDPNIKFDLLITELNGVSTMAFAKKFNCPFIVVSSMDGFDVLHRMVGNQVHSVLYPNVILGEEDGLNLLQRVIAVVFDFLVDWFIMFVYVPMDREIAEKHFGFRVNFLDLARNVSALFVNSDPIFQKPRALNPKFVQVGGTPMRLQSKPLPKELQSILDDANDGFIYFSLGSNVNSKDLSNETMNVILDTFKELPHQILWKYELEDLPNKPRNVIISKWVSQQEVLKHANLKLFITHGGLQSIGEGRAVRVPMLGMPFFADQPYNVKKLVNRGCSLSVNYRTLEKEHFKATILEMIRNPIYRKRINEMGDLAEDQPMSGLELAVWWTEYVIRHNGTDHLRSQVFDIPYYQYYLLDVIAVFILFCVIDVVPLLCVDSCCNFRGLCPVLEELMEYKRKLQLAGHDCTLLFHDVAIKFRRARTNERIAMKLAATIIVSLVGLLCYAQAECNSKTSKNTPYNCGNDGKPRFYEDDAGECKFTCMVNNESKTCAEVHPVQNMEPYIRSKCRQSAFSCDGHGKEFMSESDNYCSFGCRVGDMILSCPQIHGLEGKLFQ